MNKEAIAIVQKCLDTKDPYLDLGRLGLRDEDFAEGTKLDKLLRQCTHLQTLVLSNSWWQWDDDGKNKNYISQNKGEYNQFTTHPPALLSISGLAILIMAGEFQGKWDISDMRFVAGLTALLQLNISFNKISEIRGLEGLSSLQQLDLSENQISEIGGLEGLSSLQQLDLGGNQISKIVGLEGLSALQQLNLATNQINEIVGLERLSSLQQLILTNNQISEIAGLEVLSSLQQLYLGSNKISEIRGLEGLSSLQQLQLHNNQISEIRGLEHLTSLEKLNISKNNISDISGLQSLLTRVVNPLQIVLKEYYHQIEKGELNVKGNPLTTPPLEVVERGNEAVLRYFEKIAKEGQDYIYEAKLILVGEGSAGKTSLQVRLQDAAAPLPQPDGRTRGIDIAHWPFKTGKGENHIAHIWDFGGQDVYYPVHRFFLTENAVFVLLASTRITHHNFNYWIPTIFQFGGKSPIILGQTCHDGNKVAWADLGYYMASEHFNIIKTGVLPYHELNLLNNNEGLAGIKTAITEQILALPHYGKGVPKSWVKVREALAALGINTACVPFQQFTALCHSTSPDSFTNAIAIDDCARFLHSIGVLLWYADIEALKDWVVLQPEWAMKAVYKIIDDDEIQRRRGMILASDFDRLWQDACYGQMHGVLKKMLEVFKIAFPKKSRKQDYIMPARLLFMTAEARWPVQEPGLRLQYKYEFMPRGMVNQLSAELSRYISADNEVWNDAVNLSMPNARCQVREEFNKDSIYIKATGADARALVVLVMNGLKDITDGYKGVAPQIFVPCTCAACSQLSEPTTFLYDKLLQWEQKRENATVTCNESGEQLPIDKLLRNVGLANPVKEKAEREERKTIRIFLASSAELEADRKEVGIFINLENNRLNKEGIFIELNLWEDFIDAMSATRLQDEYNKVVRDCDIFLSLFFTKVGKYTAEEFENAFGQFSETGRPYIYTYFKDEDVKISNLNKADINSKFDFQEKLKALGHFPTQYKNMEDLKYQFKMQLEKLLPGL